MPENTFFPLPEIATRDLSLQPLQPPVSGGSVLNTDVGAKQAEMSSKQLARQLTLQQASLAKKQELERKSIRSNILSKRNEINLDTFGGQAENIATAVAGGADYMLEATLNAGVYARERIFNNDITNDERALYASATNKLTERDGIKAALKGTKQDDPRFAEKTANFKQMLLDNSLTEQEQAIYEPKLDGNAPVAERLQTSQFLEDNFTQPLKDVFTFDEDVNRKDMNRATKKIADVVNNDSDGVWEGMKKVADGEVLDGLGEMGRKIAKVGQVIAEVGIEDPMAVATVFMESSPQMVAAVLAAPVAIPAIATKISADAHEDYEKEHGHRAEGTDRLIIDAIGFAVPLLDRMGGLSFMPKKAVTELTKEVGKTVAKEALKKGITKEAAIKAMDSVKRVVANKPTTKFAKGFAGEFPTEMTQGLLEQYAGHQKVEKLDVGQAVAEGAMGGLSGGGVGAAGPTLGAAASGVGKTASAVVSGVDKLASLNSTYRSSKKVAKAIETGEISDITNRDAKDYDAEDAVIVSYNQDILPKEPEALDAHLAKTQIHLKDLLVKDMQAIQDAKTPKEKEKAEKTFQLHSDTYGKQLKEISEVSRNLHSPEDISKEITTILADSSTDKQKKASKKRIFGSIRRGDGSKITDGDIKKLQESPETTNQEQETLSNTVENRIVRKTLSEKYGLKTANKVHSDIASGDPKGGFKGVDSHRADLMAAIETNDIEEARTTFKTFREFKRDHLAKAADFRAAEIAQSIRDNAKMVRDGKFTAEHEAAINKVQDINNYQTREGTAYTVEPGFSNIVTMQELEVELLNSEEKIYLAEAVNHFGKTQVVNTINQPIKSPLAKPAPEVVVEEENVEQSDITLDDLNQEGQLGASVVPTNVAPTETVVEPTPDTTTPEVNVPLSDFISEIETNASKVGDAPDANVKKVAGALNKLIQEGTSYQVAEKTLKDEYTTADSKIDLDTLADITKQAKAKFNTTPTPEVETQEGASPLSGSTAVEQAKKAVKEQDDNDLSNRIKTITNKAITYTNGKLNAAGKKLLEGKVGKANLALIEKTIKKANPAYITSSEKNIAETWNSASAVIDKKKEGRQGFTSMAGAVAAGGGIKFDPKDMSLEEAEQTNFKMTQAGYKPLYRFDGSGTTLDSISHDSVLSDDWRAIEVLSAGTMEQDILDSIDSFDGPENSINLDSYGKSIGAGILNRVATGLPLNKGQQAKFKDMLFDNAPELYNEYYGEVQEEAAPQTEEEIAEEAEATRKAEVETAQDDALSNEDKINNLLDQVVKIRENKAPDSEGTTLTASSVKNNKAKAKLKEIQAELEALGVEGNAGIESRIANRNYNATQALLDDSKSIKEFKPSVKNGVAKDGRDNVILNDYDVKTKGRLANKLQTVSDFFNRLVLDPIKDVALTGKLSAEGRAAIPVLKNFDTLFKANFAAVFKARDPSHLEKDSFNLLLKDSVGYVKGTSFDPASIDPNLVSTMGMVGINWLNTSGNKTINNDDVGITKILGLREGSPVAQHIKDLIRTVGSPMASVAGQLGKAVLKSYGLTAKADVAGQNQGNLEQAIGNMILASLMKADMLSQTKVQNSVLDAHRDKPSNAPNADVTFIRIPHKTEKSKHGDYEIDVAADIISDFTTPIQEAKNILLDLFGITNNEKDPSFDQPLSNTEQFDKRLAAYERRLEAAEEAGEDTTDIIPPKKEALKTKGGKVFQWLSDKYSNILSKKEKRAWTVNTNMHDMVETLGEEFALRVMGLDTEYETTLHKSRHSSSKSKNALFKRVYDNYIRFSTDIANYNDGKGMSTPFYYKMFVAKNHRVHMDSNTVNPQANKFIRFMVGLTEHDSVIKLGEGKRTKSETTFLIAVGASLGLKPEENSNKEMVNKTLDMLNNEPELKKGVEALIKIKAKDHTESELAGLTADVLAAVNEGGENTHSLHGLVSYAEYATAKDSANTTEFSTNLTLEVDGKTNGTIINTIQLAAANSVESLLEFVKRGGVFEDGTKSFSDYFKRPGVLDVYQKVAKAWITQIADLNISDDKRNALAQIIGEFTDGKNDLGEDIISKVARDLAKYPLMYLGFGMGGHNIVERFSGLIAEKVYDDIAANRDNPEVLAEIQESLEKITGVELDNPITPESAINYDIDFRVVTILENEIKSTYGKALEGALESELEHHLVKRDEANNAMRIVYEGFILRYNKAVLDKKIELYIEKQANTSVPVQKDLTEEEFVKNLDDLSKEQLGEINQSLVDSMPMYKTFYATTKEEGVLSLDEVVSRPADDNHSTKTELSTELDATSVKQTTSFATQKEANEAMAADMKLRPEKRQVVIIPKGARYAFGDKKLIPNEFIGKAIVGAPIPFTFRGKSNKVTTNSTVSTWDAPGVTPVIDGAHAADSATMMGFMDKFAGLNVHDAVTIGINDVDAASSHLNQSFSNVMTDFFLRASINEALQTTMETLKKEDLDSWAILNDRMALTAPLNKYGKVNYNQNPKTGKNEPDQPEGYMGVAFNEFKGLDNYVEQFDQVTALDSDKHKKAMDKVTNWLQYPIGENGDFNPTEFAAQEAKSARAQAIQDQALVNDIVAEINVAMDKRTVNRFLLSFNMKKDGTVSGNQTAANKKIYKEHKDAIDTILDKNISYLELEGSLDKYTNIIKGTNERADQQGFDTSTAYFLPVSAQNQLPELGNNPQTLSLEQKGSGLPVYVRLTNTFGTEEKPHGYAPTRDSLKTLQKQGHDSMFYKVGDGPTQLFIFDGQNIRSTEALFNPYLMTRSQLFGSSFTSDIDPNTFTDEYTMNNEGIALTGANTLQLYDDLGKLDADRGNRTESVQHDKYLRSLISDIVNKVIEPLNVTLRRRNQGNVSEGLLVEEGDKLDVFLTQARNLRPTVTAMSSQETYAHELTHVISTKVVDGNTIAAQELRKLYAEVLAAKDAKGNLLIPKTGETFLRAGVKKGDNNYAAELAEAKRMYDYIFSSSQNGGSAVNQTTTNTKLHSATLVQINQTTNAHHEFVAHGKSNEAFRAALRTVKTKKTELGKDATLLDRLSAYFQDAVNWVRQTISKSKGENAEQRLDALFNELVSLNEEKAGMVYKAYAGVADFGGKVLQTAVGTIFWSLNRLIYSAPIRKSRSALVRTAGELASHSASVEAKHIVKVVAETYRRFGFVKEGLGKSIFNEVVGRTEDNSYVYDLIRLKNQQVDQLRSKIQRDVGAVLKNSFHEDTNLDQDHKSALTKSGIKTDLDVLLGIGEEGDKNYAPPRFTWDEIAKLYETDAKFVQQKIDSLETELTLTHKDNTNWYKRATRSLGHHMATGDPTERMHLMNAGNIVSLANQELKQEKKPEAVTALLDQLATLHAIKYTADNEKRLFSETLAAERTNNGDIDNGIITMLAMHRHLKAKALRDNFEGQNALLAKGYTKEIFNPSISFRVAPLADKAELEKQGFTLDDKYGPVRKDGEDPNKVKMAMYIDKAGLTRAHLSGIISTTSGIHKGADMLTVHAQYGELDPVISANIDFKILDKRKRNVIKQIQAGVNDHTTRVDPKEMMAIPVTDKHGNITNYRYMANERFKDTVLEKNNAFDSVLTGMASNIDDKVNSNMINKEAVEALYTDFKKDYAKNPHLFLEVGPNTSDPAYKEMYRLMPEATRKHITDVWGQDTMFVKKDIAYLVFGYRKLGVGALQKEYKINNSGDRVLKKNLNNLAEFVFNRPKVRLYEAIHQEGVKTAKDAIVIKTGTVLLGNVASNSMLLKAHGVTNKDYVKFHAEALSGAASYRTDANRLNEILLKQELFPANKKDPAIQKEVEDLRNALAINPVRSLIQLGVFQSIIDDVELVDEHYSYKNKAGEYLDPVLSKLPSWMRTVGKEIFHTQDTTSYKLMRDGTQVSDFAARYVLHTHNLKNGMAEKESLDQILATFIEYDPATHPLIQYGNDMGPTMFTKFALRIQGRIAWLVKNKPANVLGLALFQSVVGNIPDIVGDNFLFTPDAMASRFNFSLLDLFAQIWNAPLISGALLEEL